jgi:uncharacterized protein
MPIITVQQKANLIETLVERMVKAVNPRKIILFGSAARGEMKADSDIDVLVVMPDGTPCASTARYLYQKMSGFGFPLDILVTTPSSLEKHKDNLGLIYRSILAEGKEIYVA